VSTSKALVIWTIGHSNRPIEDFLALLGSQGIERVADVRRYPGSRAHPHFNPAPLTAVLGASGIECRAFPELGGRRKPAPDSVNTVWRNAAFRGYADYMETPQFRAALDGLVEGARERWTAILCSEAVWWRCHRSMIADALKAGGAEVLHIMDAREAVDHPYTSPARVVDGMLRYGAGEE
jgi:uncharacterized protein (DUF488 family)